MTNTKRRIYVLSISCIFIVISYVLYTNKYLTDIEKIISKIESNGSIVAAHRVNILEKINEIQKYNIKNIEIDVHLDNGRLMIGHEKESSSGKTLEEYFEIINITIPDFKFIWIDFKDLTLENQQQHLSTLNSLDIKYGIKNRVLIESRYINALEEFEKLGWETGYYLELELNTQPQSYINQVIADLNHYNVKSITFDCTHLDFVKKNFQDKLYNNQDIIFNCWTFKQSKYKNKHFINLRGVKYLLFSINTENHI